MAAPSVTYTFTNSTTADADQVNTNFANLISAMTDGSKSFSIDALTCAGACILNGSVTLGNATADTITANGTWSGGAVWSGAIASGATVGLVDGNAATWNGAKTFAGGILTDTIEEKTGSNGVDVASAKIRAGHISATNRLTAFVSGSDLTITKDAYRDIVFNNDSSDGAEDTGSDYVNTTGIWTCPVAGLYFVNYSFSMLSVGTAATYQTSCISKNNSTTTNTYGVTYFDSTTAGKTNTFNGSAYVTLSANDTIRIKALSQGYDGSIAAGRWASLQIILIGTV